MQKIYWDTLIIFLSQHKKLFTVSCWRSIMIALQMITENKIKLWILFVRNSSDLKLSKTFMNMLQSVQSVKKKQFINISFMKSSKHFLYHQMWFHSKRLVWTELLTYSFSCKMIKNLIAYLQLYVSSQSTCCLFLFTKLLLQLSLQSCFLSMLSIILRSVEI